MLCSVGGVEQRLGSRVELTCVVVEQNLTKALPDSGITWLEGCDDLSTMGAQRLSKLVTAFSV